MAKKSTKKVVKRVVKKTSNSAMLTNRVIMLFIVFLGAAILALLLINKKAEFSWKYTQAQRDLMPKATLMPKVTPKVTPKLITK